MLLEPFLIKVMWISTFVCGRADHLLTPFLFGIRIHPLLTVTCFKWLLPQIPLDES